MIGPNIDLTVHDKLKRFSCEVVGIGMRCSTRELGYPNLVNPQMWATRLQFYGAKVGKPPVECSPLPKPLAFRSKLNDRSGSSWTPGAGPSIISKNIGKKESSEGKEGYPGSVHGGEPEVRRCRRPRFQAAAQGGTQFRPRAALGLPRKPRPYC